jgi:hypothetical protein
VLAKDQAGAFLQYSARRIIQEINLVEGSHKENAITTAIEPVDGKYHLSPDSVRYPLAKADVTCK